MMDRGSAPRDPWIPEPIRVLAKKRETADTFTVRLDMKGRGFSFSPGQFNMVYLFGAGEVPVSISGDPEDSASLVHTIRAVGAVTRAMMRIRRGDTLGVRGPYGRGWPIAEATGKDVVVIAGGLGMAPLRPVIYRILRDRSSFRRVFVLHGARSPGDVLYRSEETRWRDRLDGNVHVTVDQAGPDWSGPVGVVPALLDRLHLDTTATVAMVCGPEVMMRYTARALARKGLSPERVFVSMERNMKCAVGFCGHCQYRELFLCKDGPVFRLDRIGNLLDRREI